MKSYWPKRSETKDHFQPDEIHEDEWISEEDRLRYLEFRKKDDTEGKKKTHEEA